MAAVLPQHNCAQQTSYNASVMGCLHCRVVSHDTKMACALNGRRHSQGQQQWQGTRGVEVLCEDLLSTQANQTHGQTTGGLFMAVGSCKQIIQQSSRRTAQGVKCSPQEKALAQSP